MGERILLCLEEQHLVEIQRLLLDEDEEGALNFLASVVWPKIETTMREGLRKEMDIGKGPDQFWMKDKEL